jgi:probable HAF family extracellular repeat protein
VLYTNGGATITPLGYLTPPAGPATYSSRALALSNDGQVVYGYSFDASNKQVAFRWTQATGYVSLGLVAPSDTSSSPTPRGVSSDGSVMIGTRFLSAGVTTLGYRYTTSGGFQTIPTLSGGTWSSALAVTADGNTVLVQADSSAFPNGEAAFWTPTGGYTLLGSPDASLRAEGGLGGLTSDGSAAVVAFANASNVPFTFILNHNGYLNLQSVLTANGVDLTGWSSLYADGISPDGRLIYGFGLHNGSEEGFVAELPAGFVATAIPEPSTYAALAGLAALGFVTYRRRDRRRQHV